MLALLSAAICAAPVKGVAQSSGRPLTEAEVIDLLRNSVPSPRLQELVRKLGVSFQMTRDTERDLKDAGADEDLLSVLNEIAPGATHAPSKPPAGSSNPPAALATLEIQSDPGSSAVYVDDEPVGTTSSEGRLKLTKFSAGEHRVRVAHAGFREVEQKAQLTAGQTATVFASLQPAQQTNPLAAPPATPPPNTGSQSALPPGSLGIFLLPLEGAQGMSVGAVVPGSPAASLGMRPDDVVLSIGGQLIRNSQDVGAVMVGHHQGDTMEVTFKNSSGVQSKSAQLAGPGILSSLVHYQVNHDHGTTFCTGWMILVGGRIVYTGEVPPSAGGVQVPVHTFSISVGDIKEVKRNPFYLALLGAFHIRLKNGTNMNFVVVDSNGLAQRPEPLIEAIHQAGAGR
jgi:PEGA domain/PDZ domain